MTSSRLRPTKHTTGDGVIPLLLHHIGIAIPLDIGAIGIEWQVLIGTLIANFCVIGCASLVIPASGRNRVSGRFHLLMGSGTDLGIGSSVIIRATAKAIASSQIIAIIGHSGINDRVTRRTEGIVI